MNGVPRCTWRPDLEDVFWGLCFTCYVPVAIVADLLRGESPF